MKFNRCIQRTFGWLVWCLFTGVAMYLMFWILILEHDPCGLFVLIFPAFVSLWLSLLLYTYPKVSLDRQGIYVKWLFRTRFYSWDGICQVGISCFYPKGYYINRLVLVRNGCSKRGYRDFLFHIRNLGKLIYVPANSDVIAYVRSCYGPLDFNLTDGKIEQSIVVDD